MFTNTKAVIFDLDGTLIDSMWVWTEIDVEYMKKYNLSEPPNFHQSIEGKSFTEVADYFREVFPQLDRTSEEICAEWMDMAYEKYRTEVPLKDGAKEFLVFLKGKNIRMGISTSNHRELVDAVLESHDIASYFEFISTDCDVKRGKPAPDVYLMTADRMQVLPKDCLVFEDVPNGILAGKRAGMRVCAMEDAFSSELKEQKKELADYYAENYFEVMKGLV